MRVLCFIGFGVFKLLKEIHTTVEGTIRDLQTSGWEIIKTPKKGSVIVWEKIDFGKDGIHKHIGFYIGNKNAISNRLELGHPAKHHFTFQSKRKIEVIFWHAALK